MHVTPTVRTPIFGIDGTLPFAIERAIAFDRMAYAADRLGDAVRDLPHNRAPARNMGIGVPPIDPAILAARYPGSVDSHVFRDNAQRWNNRRAL